MGNRFRFLNGIISGVLLCSLFFTGCSQGDSFDDSKVSSSETEYQVVLTESADTTSDQTEAGETTETIPEDYPYRTDVETVLIMGIDKFIDTPVDGLLQADSFGYINNQQSDFMMLLVIDKENKVCDAIHINRDSIVPVTRLGIGGRPVGKFNENITLAHTYGDGGEISCENSCKAVSELFKGVKIDHYIAVSMDGFVKLNDLAGGVTVTVPLDMTYYTKNLKDGAQVHLMGNDANWFVRGRMYIGDGSNVSRMERQRYYLGLLYDQFMKKISEDPLFIAQTLGEILPYITTDLSITDFTGLCESLYICKLNPFTLIDGEEVMGAKFKEFHVDSASIDRIVNSLFAVK